MSPQTPPDRERGPAYECVSADAGAVRVRDLRAGHGWSFGLVECDGRRDLPPDEVQEEPPEGGRPASFIAIAGAYMFALQQARSRGLIDR